MLLFTIMLDAGNLIIFSVLLGLSLCVVTAHITWPVTARLLYRLQSLHVFAHRKVVFSLGISLFTLGLGSDKEDTGGVGPSTRGSADRTPMEI
jgi:hypothetical protein